MSKISAIVRFFWCQLKNSLVSILSQSIGLSKPGRIQDLWSNPQPAKTWKFFFTIIIFFKKIYHNLSLPCGFFFIFIKSEGEMETSSEWDDRISECVFFFVVYLWHRLWVKVIDDQIINISKQFHLSNRRSLFRLSWSVALSPDSP